MMVLQLSLTARLRGREDQMWLLLWLWKTLW